MPVYLGRRIRESAWAALEGASPEVEYYLIQGLCQMADAFNTVSTRRGPPD